jgi:hypothetical protein
MDEGGGRTQGGIDGPLRSSTWQNRLADMKFQQSVFRVGAGENINIGVARSPFACIRNRVLQWTFGSAQASWLHEAGVGL